LGRHSRPWSSIGGTLSQPQGCVGSTCGTLAGFHLCGGERIGCGIDYVQGTIASHDGEPITFDVSDASRFLTIDTSVLTDTLIGLELTATLPDGLQILTISDPIPNGVAQTPLPATLPLFAIGLGVLFVLTWWGKWAAISGAAAQTSVGSD
jgi:hypothetical protein